MDLKKHLLIKQNLFYLGIFCAAVWGCTEENAPSKTLQLGQSELTVDAPAGSTSVTLTSNTKWTVTSTATWITVFPTSGTGNSILAVNYAAMIDTDQRTGSIIVQAGNIQQKVDIIQDQRIKLTQVQGILGNLETRVGTTVVLTFNTSVSVRDIWDTFYPSIPSLVENFSVNGNQVTFIYSIQLSDEYPFTIDLENGYSFSFKVSFHKSKLSVPGKMVDYFIRDDNSNVWAITQNPNQLINLSLPDLNILKTLPLSFIPEKVRWNYYHGNLMIFDPSTNDSSFRYVDPVSLAIRKVLVDPYDGAYDVTFGLQHASDMCQMKDGSGIMQTELYGGDYGWRYIDKKDSTWLNPSAYSPRPPIAYDEIFHNYDQSKIIMLYPGGSTNVDVWQMGTDTLHTIYPPDVAYGPLYLTVNKTQDLILHVHASGQYITDLSGYISQTSYLSGFDSKFNSAFSYRNGEDQVIYIIADGFINVMDYKNAYTNLSAPVNSSFNLLQSTSDGKYITGFIDNGNSADFCVYDLNSILVNATKYGSSTGGRVRSIGNKSNWSPH